MMIDCLKLYGERNTNTNYLEKLIALNLEVEQLPGVVPQRIKEWQAKLPGEEWLKDLYFKLSGHHNLGWKHRMVPPFDKSGLRKLAVRKVGIVTLTKNPYSWLHSLYRNPYHQYYTHKPSFEEFLRMPWQVVDRDGLHGPLPSPMFLWNHKNRAYRELNYDKHLAVMTEQIFECPATVTDTIADTFQLSRKDSQFVNYERSTKKSGRDSEWYRRYYLEEQWADGISEEAFAIMNEGLDHSLMDAFGYARRES